MRPSTAIPRLAMAFIRLTVWRFHKIGTQRGGRMDRPKRRDERDRSGISRVDESETERQHTQKMETVGVLASSVAHDFGNLLHGIMGATAIALSPDTPPDRARAYLQRVLESCRRGSSLVAQIMTYSRKQPEKPSPVFVDHLIDEWTALLERLLGEHIELVVETHAPDAALLADPMQLQRVLLNLAANARAAMPAGGTLTLSTRKVERDADDGTKRCHVRLVVADTGSGMDAETKARIFDPFFTTKNMGTGLGLATALDTVHALGGRIEVYSAPGRGTAFVIELPLVDCPKKMMVPQRSRPQIKFRGRALLVEDDSLVRITVRHYLEELGFETIEAESGSDALALAQIYGNEFTLVVTDVTLPGESGPQLVKQLRVRYPNNFSVLFMTAHSPHELVAQGLVVDKDRFLMKPFERSDLEEALAELLPRRLRRRPSIPVGMPGPVKVTPEVLERAKNG